MKKVAEILFMVKVDGDKSYGVSMNIGDRDGNKEVAERLGDMLEAGMEMLCDEQSSLWYQLGNECGLDGEKITKILKKRWKR